MTSLLPLIFTGLIASYSTSTYTYDDSGASTVVQDFTSGGPIGTPFTATFSDDMGSLILANQTYTFTTHYTDAASAGGSSLDSGSGSFSGFSAYFHPTASGFGGTFTTSRGNLDADAGGETDITYTLQPAQGAAFAWPTPIPEPSTWAIQLLGLSLLGVALRRRTISA